MINENIETAKADANAKVITDTGKTQASFMEAREMTIESVFGVKAGIVWGALNQNGPSTIGDIVQARSLRREEVYGALGWLGRENKITVERNGRALVFSLRP